MAVGERRGGLCQDVPSPRDQEDPGDDQGIPDVAAEEQEEGGAAHGHPEGGGGAHGEQGPPDRGGDQGGGQGGGPGLRGPQEPQELAGRARVAELLAGVPPDPDHWRTRKGWLLVQIFHDFLFGALLPVTCFLSSSCQA